MKTSSFKSLSSMLVAGALSVQLGGCGSELTGAEEVDAGDTVTTSGALIRPELAKPATTTTTITKPTITTKPTTTTAIPPVIVANPVPSGDVVSTGATDLDRNFPWSVFITGTGGLSCRGTLIHPLWVLDRRPLHRALRRDHQLLAHRRVGRGVQRLAALQRSGAQARHVRSPRVRGRHRLRSAAARHRAHPAGATLRNQRQHPDGRPAAVLGQPRPRRHDRDRQPRQRPRGLHVHRSHRPAADLRQPRRVHLHQPAGGEPLPRGQRVGLRRNPRRARHAGRRDQQHRRRQR